MELSASIKLKTSLPAPSNLLPAAPLTSRAPAATAQCLSLWMCPAQTFL